MLDSAPLIATITAGLGLAFLLGLLVTRIGLPPIVGYLLAGVLVGPHSPGFTADIEIAGQLAEIGVIMLMFGVGLHFSLTDLLSVKRIAIPGAIGRIVIVTGFGAVIARLWGWPLGEGLVFGLALSVASTVVLLRALEQRGGLDSFDGKLAVGWLVVEDLVMVLVLVLLPAFAASMGTAPDLVGDAGERSLLLTLGITLAKVAAFFALVLIAGRRIVPWMLEHVAHTGSRELFTLAVLATALGIALGSAVLFGVSVALGAFFAGVVINGSDLSYWVGASPQCPPIARRTMPARAKWFRPRVARSPWPAPKIRVRSAGPPPCRKRVSRAARSSSGTPTPTKPPTATVSPSNTTRAAASELMTLLRRILFLSQLAGGRRRPSRARRLAGLNLPWRRPRVTARRSPSWPW